MKHLKRFLITLLVIVVVLALVGGYFGLVPGVSKIFGSDKPRDLGVTYTEQDRLAGRAKIGWQIKDLPADAVPEQSLKYSGQVAVKASFTNQELTAWINKSWKYVLLTDAQIRINPDNTAEISGVIHTDRIEAYAKAMGFTGQLEDFLGPYQRFIVGNPTIYLKAKPSITNNNVVANVQELQIGRISVPTSWLESNAGTLENLAEQQIKAIPGASVKSLTFSSGKANFDGTLPAVISSSKGN